MFLCQTLASNNVLDKVEFLKVHLAAVCLLKAQLGAVRLEIIGNIRIPPINRLHCGSNFIRSIIYGVVHEFCNLFFADANRNPLSLQGKPYHASRNFGTAHVGRRNSNRCLHLVLAYIDGKERIGCLYVVIPSDNHIVIIRSLFAQFLDEVLVNFNGIAPFGSRDNLAL